MISNRSSAFSSLCEQPLLLLLNWSTCNGMIFTCFFFCCFRLCSSSFFYLITFLKKICSAALWNFTCWLTVSSFFSASSSSFFSLSSVSLTNFSKSFIYSFSGSTTGSSSSSNCIRFVVCYLCRLSSVFKALFLFTFSFFAIFEFFWISKADGAFSFEFSKETLSFLGWSNSFISFFCF